MVHISTDGRASGSPRALRELAGIRGTLEVVDIATDFKKGINIRTANICAGILGSTTTVRGGLSRATGVRGGSLPQMHLKRCIHVPPEELRVAARGIANSRHLGDGGDCALVESFLAGLRAAAVVAAVVHILIGCRVASPEQVRCATRRTRQASVAGEILYEQITKGLGA